MEPSQQVVDFELSKKLKVLDLNYDSYFTWWACEKAECDCKEKLTLHTSEASNLTNYPAYTVSELLNLIPHMVDTKQNEPFNFFRFNLEKSFTCDLAEYKKTDTYIVNYQCDSRSPDDGFIIRRLTRNIYDANPANALAKMIIFLIESKLY